MQATFTSTLPGPEPGGTLPPGTSPRRTAPARDAGAAHAASMRGARDAGRDDDFGASLDDAVRDDARRADDDSRGTDRASDGRRAKAADAPVRRASAQPWWLRAQAERPATPDADADADGLTAAGTGTTAGPAVDEQDTTTTATADAGDGTATPVIDPALAALLAAQAQAAAAVTPTPTVEATDGATHEPDAATADGSAIVATSGPNGQDPAALLAAALPSGVGEGTTPAEAAQATVAASAAHTPAAPQASATAAHRGAHAGRAGWALQALRQAAAMSGSATGPLAGAVQAGAATDARAAARAVLSAAAEGLGLAPAPDVNPADGAPRATTAAIQDPQASLVDASLLAMATSAGGGQAGDPGSRDAGPGTGEPTIEVGAKIAGGAGGSAPVFVMPAVLTTPEPAAAGFAVPVTGTESGTEMPNASENLGRLIQTFRMQAREGMSEATVRLNPTHLGEVTIAIKVDKGIVSATVQAETGSVRQWLQSQEENLRATLADQGLTLEHYAVEPDGQRRQQAPDEDQQAQARRRARARQSDDRTFEVVA